MNNLKTLKNEIKLLHLIDLTGSILQSAKKLGISVTAAKNMLCMLEKIYGSSIVQSRSGGLGGGGSMLTAIGHKIITQYDNLKTK